MASLATEQVLKRKLDALRSLDMSAMGYEAKARHRQRLERAQRAWDKAANCTRSQPPPDRTLAPVD